MSSLPIDATLIGKDTTNPALPSQNVRGTLTIEDCNLNFSGEGFSYKIPLEHLDSLRQWDKHEGWGNEWRFIVTFLLSGLIITVPLFIWLFWWYYTAIEVHIIVTAWDEEYGLKATTIYSLGKQRIVRSEAPLLIQETWRIRGDCRNRDRKQGQIVYREE